MRPLPRGLYAIADAGFGDPVTLGRALADAGARVIQLRCKGWPEAEVADAARALLPALRRQGAALIINDHLDVAVAGGADGVHLGQEDGPTALARARLPPGALLGRSTRTLEQVAEAQDADYLGFGPIYATNTRPGLPPPRGVDLLAAAVRASARPLVAIGGISPENLPAVRATGVHAWAVIRALLEAPDLAAMLRDLSVLDQG